MLYNLFENRDFVSVFAVALLAEGVDRNHAVDLLPNAGQVALLAEGVDRNMYRVHQNQLLVSRPPRGGRG